MWDRLLVDCNIATLEDMPGNPLGVVENGAIGIDGGKIVRVGKRTELAGFRAKEVVVETTGWSDYVFDRDYKLLSLSEVEKHIESEGHLPGVPSAKQVAEQGISLGEMQAKLLAKIEELTLHQIRQEKEIEKLKAENASLRARFESK